MVRLDPPLRLGTEADAPIPSVLHNEAAHDIALHAWRPMAPGLSPGASRAMVKAGRDGPRAEWILLVKDVATA